MFENNEKLLSVTYFLPYASLKQLCILMNDCFDIFGRKKYSNIIIYVGDTKPILKMLINSKGLKSIKASYIERLMSLIINEEIELYQIKQPNETNIIKLCDDRSFILNMKDQRLTLKNNWIRDFDYGTKLENFMRLERKKVMINELNEIYILLSKIIPYYEEITIKKLVDEDNFLINEVCHIEAYPSFKCRETYDMTIYNKTVHYELFDNFENIEKKACDIILENNKKLEKNKYYNISSLYEFEKFEYRVLDLLETDIVTLNVKTLLKKSAFVIVYYDQIIADKEVIRHLTRRKPINLIYGEKPKIHGFRSK